MWFRSRPVPIVILAAHLVVLGCGGGGDGAPAAPSEPLFQPATRSYTGDWRGRYSNTFLDVLSRCRDEAAPLEFGNFGVYGHDLDPSEMTVAIQSNLSGVIEITRLDETVTCPFEARVAFDARLSATVDAESCMPPNVRVPSRGYTLAPIPPGCQGREGDVRAEAWAELRTLDITIAIDNTSRDYPILIVNISETGHFHDPRDYYMGAYTAENSAWLTHPEDPRIGG